MFGFNYFNAEWQKNFILEERINPQTVMSINVKKLINEQNKFFSSETTKEITFRKQSLIKLKSEIIKREKDICIALYNDFKKPEFEALGTETQIVIAELNKAINNLKKWARPKWVAPNLASLPSSNYIYSEPYGTVLIIGPWNYPFQLVFGPLVGAIAAGNTAVVKPSELTPSTSKVCSEIIEAVFDKNHVACVEGGVEVSQELLKQRWDYIFFTGSTTIGKIVYKAAAEHLTPVTLELGGKNPCVVDETANLKQAAARIAWGKLLNCGQTCIAPDYLLIKREVKDEFIECLKNEFSLLYGENAEVSPDYLRIINERNFNRLEKMLLPEKTAFGGKTNKENLFISPTIIDSPPLDSAVMADEIFGPILPIIPYETEAEIESALNKHGKPLSFYIFSKRKKFINELLKKHSFGGGVINDTLFQYSNARLPFGGVGLSGIGAYHGKYSFDTFSHKKSVMKRATWLQIRLFYAPYKGKERLVKLLHKIL